MPPADFDRLRQYLIALARREVPATDAARVDPSGVVQQTLAEAANDRRFGELDPGRQRGWLRTAFARDLADEYRRMRADKRDAGREVAAAFLDSGLVADLSSPSQRADRAEQARRLTAALAALPAGQREAVERHYLHGQPLAAVATAMGKSPAAVGGLLKRGLAGLRAVFDRPEEG